jgi:hypothetical protein
MKAHGSCHCGAIEFEALVDSARVTICHRTDCQNLTGTAYRVTVAASTAARPTGRSASFDRMTGWERVIEDTTGPSARLSDADAEE